MYVNIQNVLPTTRCMLGRSNYWPKIYSVCMGIWWQITFFKNEFWTIHEKQSKVKILGNTVCSPNLRDEAVLESVQLRFNFSCVCLQVGGKKLSYRQMYEKLKHDWTFSRTATTLKFGQCNLLPRIITLLFIWISSICRNVGHLKRRYRVCNESKVSPLFFQ